MAGTGIPFCWMGDGGVRKAGVIALVSICSILSGCINYEKQFPTAKDYCKEQGRHIPDFEKKLIILTRWYGMEGNLDYLKNYVVNDVGPNASKEKISQSLSRYLKVNPLCCQIVKPDHQTNQIWNGDAWAADQGYIKAYEWGYVGDFFIFHAPPFYDLGGEFSKKEIHGIYTRLPGNKFTYVDQGIPYMMNNCGDTRSFDRG
jgi:hypothetical protein